MAAVVLVATVEKEETTPFFRHRSDLIMVWGVGFTRAASGGMGALSGGFVELKEIDDDISILEDLASTYLSSAPFLNSILTAVTLDRPPFFFHPARSTNGHPKWPRPPVPMFLLPSACDP